MPSGIGMLLGPIVGYNLAKAHGFDETSYDVYFYVCGGLQAISACLALYLCVTGGNKKKNKKNKRTKQTGALPGSAPRISGSSKT